MDLKARDNHESLSRARRTGAQPSGLPATVASGVQASTAAAAPHPLRDAFAALVDQHGTGDSIRPPLVAVLKGALDEGTRGIRQRFEAGQADATACVHETCALVDDLIRVIADFTTDTIFPCASPTVAERFDLVATGGYGRGELAPASDIDLLFLLPYKRTARVEQIVEFILYTLWDLGLKVGHAVRSIDECIRHAKEDNTIRTNLLELRSLWGDSELLAELRRRYAREVMVGNGPAFVVAKLAERDERHRRMGDSRYLLEPNIKEGKGGLRDLQTLFWIGKFLYQVDTVDELVAKGVFLKEEAAGFLKAQRFLWSVRCHLHYFTGRAEDRLTLDLQAEIGRRMGYTDHAGAVSVERFMKHYFLVAKDVGDLTRVFCAALEAESKRPPRFNFLPFTLGRRKEMEGFLLDGERLSVRIDHQFKDQPIDIMRLFHVSYLHGIDIHPRALRALTRSVGVVRRLRNDPEANRLFLEILTGRDNPEATLRRMSEAGVLARFIPDFGRVVAQMQYDMYHSFTVDEHTLQAIGIAHALETGVLAEELPLGCAVARELVSHRALRVAVLLHDIAKGRGGDHSALGEKVAEKLCPRFGLTPEECETVAWLVRHHLVLSATAFRRDLEDEGTVRDFVEMIQSPERLRLLLVLTIADIRAVGPNRWNAWRGALLGELYHQALERMSGGLGPVRRQERVRLAQERVRAALTGWSNEEIDWFLSLGYTPYWLAFDTETQARHASLVREAERNGCPLDINTRIDRGRGVTEVTIYTGDHPGLFSQLTGAMALAGANIVDARIFTLNNGKALDVFWVQDAHAGGPLDSGEKLARLAVMTEQTLRGLVRPLQELAKRRPMLSPRTRAAKVEPRVLVDNQISSTHTVIEVNGRDRPGLLHDLTRTLTDLSLQITTAKISTYGARAIDVFYVKDVFGHKVAHATKIRLMHDRLMDVLADADQPAVKPVTKRGNDAAVKVARKS